jgi:exopolysaccharide biosynthesis polyprenyl glycosylphosphotransferase
VIKRIVDVVVSTAGLLLTWPLFIAVWIAVKLDSPGPAIFIAKRVGENGKIFNMLKFRTMYINQENVQASAHSGDEVCEIGHKVKDDPRVTRVGRFLRRTSLDELPQLVNVLKGEMSLVGPRPEQPFLTQCYDHWQWQRLAVPPGVTGWWQISGRSDLPMHLNTQYDMYYVRNFSVLLDLKILFKTVGTVLKGKGAY